MNCSLDLPVVRTSLCFLLRTDPVLLRNYHPNASFDLTGVVRPRQGDDVTLRRWEFQLSTNAEFQRANRSSSWSNE